MTFRILQVLIILLPFVLIPNQFECFRSIKETIFQCAGIMIIAASFFDSKIREYKNKPLTYLIIYMALLFVRYFSVSYMWGGTIDGVYWRSIQNTWCLIPTFNMVLGFIMLKVIIENIDREQVLQLSRLVCYVTAIISVHMILQKFDVMQVYGREAVYNGTHTGKNYTGWLANNRVISFIGNPMLAGSYVALASHFNLLFNEKKHYIFYVLGLGACIATMTTSSLLTFVVMMMIFLLVYYRKIGIPLLVLGTLGGLMAFKHSEFISSSHRVEIWKKAIKGWWEVPYTGAGLGSFRIQKFVDITGTQWWQAHSEPLQFLFETGLIGLGIIFWVLVDFFKKITLDREVFIFTLIIFGGLVNSFFSFPLHIAPIVFVLILAFGFREILKED